jgi:hypothetical protein
LVNLEDLLCVKKRNLGFNLFVLLVGTTFTKSLVLSTEDISLFSESLGTNLFSLSLVDVFHQDTLVLETVTLGLEVELVVQVLVDLASFSVLGQETTEDTHTAHPDNLAGHTSIGGTLSLTVTHVTTVTLGSSTLEDTEARLRDLGLTNDQTILDELTDVGTFTNTVIYLFGIQVIKLTRVGVGDFVDFIGVEPDLSLTTLEDGSSKTLLDN